MLIYKVRPQLILDVGAARLDVLTRRVEMEDRHKQTPPQVPFLPKPTHVDPLNDSTSAQ